MKIISRPIKIKNPDTNLIDVLTKNKAVLTNFILYSYGSTEYVKDMTGAWLSGMFAGLGLILHRIDATGVAGHTGWEFFIDYSHESSSEVKTMLIQI